MPASNDSALVLAGQLRTLSDAALAELLTAREIRGTGIRDFFDLADALLDPAAIQHALGRLDRSTLATLAALGELGPVTEADAATHLTTLGADAALLPDRLATAERLALLTQHLGRWVVPASVAEQLQLWPSLGLPSLHELVSLSAPAALSPVSGVDVKFTDHVASENAFQTTTSIAELIATLDLESARELARGGIALPDSKRLAAAMGVDLDRVSGLLDIASRAGLVALDSGRWMPAEASRTWMVDSSGERWALLATAWLERLPVDIRTILRERAHAVWGERLEEYVAWLFPAGDDWMRDRVRVYTRDAELLGITADNVPSTPGAALLASGADAAATAMAALFPPEVAQVYLQHDLSIVSPGPLAPPIDARLRTMADVEGRALASIYRVSTASLSRAMAAGETESSIREFLGGCRGIAGVVAAIRCRVLCRAAVAGPRRRNGRHRAARGRVGAGCVRRALAGAPGRTAGLGARPRKSRRRRHGERGASGVRTRPCAGRNGARAADARDRTRRRAHRRLLHRCAHGMELPSARPDCGLAQGPRRRQPGGAERLCRACRGRARSLRALGTGVAMTPCRPPRPG